MDPLVFLNFWLFGIIIVRLSGQWLANRLSKDYGNLAALYFAAKGLPLKSPKSWAFALAWPLSALLLGISAVKQLLANPGRSASVNDPLPPPIGWVGREDRRETASEAQEAKEKRPPDPPKQIVL